jgi:hypothetical protein
MVRWPPGLHAQAAKRDTSTLSWRPGFLGSGARPITPVPVRRYTQKISGVPLTGGQAQGVFLGYPAASGTANSPPIFTTVAGPITVPAAGTYVVQWSVTLSGTLSAADVDNFALVVDDSVGVANSVNPGAAGTYPQAPVTLRLDAGQTLEIGTRGNATAGSVYGASIPAQGGPLTLSVAPQGMGTVWYPLQVTLSTTTGPLDTSVASVYLGPAITPITLVGTVYSGNGTVALAIPSMSPGQVLVAQWTGGHLGDTASMNVIGSMDALGTG